MKNHLKEKLIAVIVLCACIVLGMVYLVLSPKGSATEPVSTPTASSAIETSTPAPTAVPTEVPADTVSDDSITRLIDQEHTVSADYVPASLQQPDVTSNHMQTVRSELVQPLIDMFADAESAGYDLKLVSGYRSYTEQTSLWYTYEERHGRSYAQRIDDHPGASEHQLGLAVDLGNASGRCELNACFAYSDAYTWLKENSYRYGFIERYPDGAEQITGIMYSPWHYRYVGIEEAEKIHASGLTMDEHYLQH